jgi:predicted RNase H-like HicB family nuclease
METKSSPGRMLPLHHLIVVRPDGTGQFKAQVVGIPEVFALGATPDEAIAKARRGLIEWLATAQWVTVEVPTPTAGHPLLEVAGHADPNDPAEKEYLEELARMRREDLERTLREYDQECPNSSSTPTT